MGVLIKGPEVLESTRRIDTIVLDKTGTVTTGRMSLVEVVAAADTDPAEVLRFAGALEDASEHPIAQAVATAAKEKAGTGAGSGALKPVAGFANVEGHGVRGTVDGRDVVVGKESLLEGWNTELSSELSEAKDKLQKQGKTVMVVGWDGAARGLIAVADTVKETSGQAIAQLHICQIGGNFIIQQGQSVADAALIGFLHLPDFFTWLRLQSELVLPPQALEQVNPVIDQLQQSKGGLLSVGIVIALWTASAGVRLMMSAMNAAYDVVEGRPLWKRFPLSIISRRVGHGVPGSWTYAMSAKPASSNTAAVSTGVVASCGCS